MYQITYLLLTKYTLAQLISSYLTLFMRHEAKKVLFAFIAFEVSSFQERDTKLDLFLPKIIILKGNYSIEVKKY